jgi:hypothetical protein
LYYGQTRLVEKRLRGLSGVCGGGDSVAGTDLDPPRKF